MNLVDVFLWVIFPYTVVAIFIMSVIWQYDGTLQEDQNLMNGFRLKKLTLLPFHLSLLGFITSGLILLIKYGALTVFSFLLNWSVGLVTLNPNMNVLSEQPVLLVFHLFFSFLLMMTSFKHSKQIIRFYQHSFSTFLLRKETADVI